MAKGRGIALYSVSLGPDADRSCLSRLASSPAHYYEARQTDTLIAVFRRIYADIAEVEVRRLTLFDRLPANMFFVPKALGDPSDHPVWDPIARELTWVTEPVARIGVTHTFQVLPVEAGTWPTNVEATGAFLDLTGASGRFTFAVPRITVLDPIVPPTPAEPEPTATPTFPGEGAVLFLPPSACGTR